MKHQCLLLLLVVAKLLQAQHATHLTKASVIPKQQAAFEENKGQIWDMDNQPASYVQYHYHAKGLDLFMLPAGLVYQFTNVHYPEGWATVSDLAIRERRKELEQHVRTETYRMDMELVGANLNPTIIAEGKTKDYTHYYNRNVLEVHRFEKLIYKDVYAGIDWVIYTTDHGLKYDFVVAAGADPHQIKLRFKHHKALTKNADGSLSLSSSMGKVTEQAPVSFQGETVIPTQFQLNDNTVSFQLSDYDPTNMLVIDPTLIWATYYGGTSNDAAWACATDQQGNVYLAGEANSSTNIASGGHQNTLGSSYDAFLVKLDSSGVRQWSTYYGGLDYEEGHSCAVDAQGNVYLAGETQSANNIAFSGHQNIYGGQNDAYLVKFNSSGIRQWGTYYGGASTDEGHGCAVDAQGNVYLTGMARSITNIASNGHQDTSGGQNDAYLVKFNSNGVRQWGTYYGGSSYDKGYDCTTDAQGNVYLTGQTNSTNNIAIGGHQMTAGGSNDAFLVKFNSNGVRQWGTYYAGSDADWGYSCKIDAQGNIYLAGTTRSTNNIAFNGAQMTFGGISDAFLVKFNNSGVRQWATYYGGVNYEESFSCALDAQGNVYFSGTTSSPNNIALGGHQNTYGGGMFDGYLVKFNSSGVRQWGTYYGGTERDRALACATDVRGNVYITGFAYSTANIALGGHQNTYTGRGDAFLAKFLGEACKPSASTIITTSCGAFNHNGKTYTVSGTYSDTLTNAIGCDSIVTLNLTIHTVDTTTTMVGTTITANASGASYQWLSCDNNNMPILGATYATFTPTTNGNYAVAVTQNGCTDTSACVPVFVVSSQLLAPSSISVYPNPTTGAFILNLGQQAEAMVTLYAIDGRQLYQQVVQGKNRHHLAVEGPIGPYLLHIKTNDQVQYIQLMKK